MAMLSKSAVNIQLQGYTPANRDATVKLVNQSTGQVIERKPFLDGSLLVRDVDPGMYQLEVRHPNLISADRDAADPDHPPAPPRCSCRSPSRRPSSATGRSRTSPTRTSRPVQQAAAAARAQLAPISSKAPGEVIRAADWNAARRRGHGPRRRRHGADPARDAAGPRPPRDRRQDRRGPGQHPALQRVVRPQPARAAARHRDATAAADDRGRPRRRRRDRRGPRRGSSTGSTTSSRTLQVDTSLFTRNLTVAGNQFLTEINDLAHGPGSRGRDVPRQARGQAAHRDGPELRPGRHPGPSRGRAGDVRQDARRIDPRQDLMATVAELERLDALVSRLTPLRLGPARRAHPGRGLERRRRRAARGAAGRSLGREGGVGRRPRARRRGEHRLARSAAARARRTRAARGAGRRGPRRPPRSADRAGHRAARRRSTRGSSRRGRSPSDLATRDEKRETDLHAIRRTVESIPDAREDVLTLRESLRGIQTDVRRAIEIGEGLEVGGVRFDAAAYDERLRGVEALRTRLTAPTGRCSMRRPSSAG